MAEMTTAEKLADARSKYHKLITGSLRVIIRDGGSTMEYTQANKSDLKMYISELEAQLALELDPNTAQTRRPAGVIF